MNARQYQVFDCSLRATSVRHLMRDTMSRAGSRTLLPHSLTIPYFRPHDDNAARQLKDCRQLIIASIMIVVELMRYR